MSSIRNNIFFRADGNSKIGLGHVIRSLALADMLKTEFDCSFFCIDPSTYIQHEIASCGKLICLQNEEEFVTSISNKSIVVLDGYQFSTTYMQNIVNAGAKLIYIDDLHDRYYPAHLVINHNPGAKVTDYNKASYTHLLLGLDYALLRMPFREAAKLPHKRTSYTNLLISMGGADPYNLGHIVAEGALLSEQFQHISILGSPEKNSPFNYSSQVTIHKNLNAQNVAKLMLDSDIMIAPASSVTMEAFSTGLPVICGYYEDNQKDFYHYMNDNNFIFGIGNLKNIQSKDLPDIYKEGIKFFNRTKIPKLIDGNQSIRFIHEFKHLINKTDGTF